MSGRPARPGRGPSWPWCSRPSSFAVVGAAAYVAAHRIARADALSEALRTAHGVGRWWSSPGCGRARRHRAAAPPWTRPSPPGGRTAPCSGSWCGVPTSSSGPTTTRWSVVRCRSALGWRRCSPAGATTPSLVAERHERRDEQERSAHLVEAYIPMTPAGHARWCWRCTSRTPGSGRPTGSSATGSCRSRCWRCSCSRSPSCRSRSGWSAEPPRRSRSGTGCWTPRWSPPSGSGGCSPGICTTGVVQELAGAAFLLESREPAAAPPPVLRAMTAVTQTLRRAVGDLRDMLVELHPRRADRRQPRRPHRDLGRPRLPGPEGHGGGPVDRPLSPEVAAFLYRCARECAINVAKHAAASRVEITLDSDAAGIRLVVRDDGVGVAPVAAATATSGSRWSARPPPTSVALRIDSPAGSPEGPDSPGRRGGQRGRGGPGRAARGRRGRAGWGGAPRAGGHGGDGLPAALSLSVDRLRRRPQAPARGGDRTGRARAGGLPPGRTAHARYWTADGRGRNGA